ncbi:hypothetical protein KIV56_05315 [Cryobacterium breve]|jgi:uridine kinase|uniref:Uridine kinase n=1 Tax=Cryobacterium breve TaxID=1259258 RepID=A0ABY7NEU8_9MICO|nr:hypothetical protein [Cryobacterium breve]WBM80769.1 hypothetical protein KIV56_05315 [Cryobacterium breve]
MTLDSTPRLDFLRDLTTEILGFYSRGRTMVAIDGTDPVARAAFADDLAAAFAETGHAVSRASLADFERSAEEQAAFGPASPERLFRHRDDFDLLRRALLVPFRLAGGTTGPADDTLIFDGDFLLRKELRDGWSFSVLTEYAADAATTGAFIDLAAELKPSGELGDAADTTTDPALGASPVPDDQALADRLYRAEVRPRSWATAVVDLANPADPRRLFFDSC